MYKIFITILTLLFLVAPAVAENCKDLPVFQNLDCKDKKATKKALEELHKCMKGRFVYKDVIHTAAWPLVEIPETGSIVGGDGEWALGCLQAWPCPQRRLVFIEEMGGMAQLVMVHGNYILGHEFDEVVEAKDLSKHKLIRISGKERDVPWYKIDLR